MQDGTCCEFRHRQGICLMGLEGRLRRLESRVKPAHISPERCFDLDECLTKMGLVPAAVRELARSTGSSLVEAACQTLGIKVRDFKKALEERIERIGL